MDITKLSYFCKIVECGSYKQASQELHISQPALSKSIKLLEEEIETKLIIPSGRGIEITQSGLVLAGKAQNIIDQYQNFVATIKGDLPHRQKSLRIGSFEVFSTHFLGRIFKDEFLNRTIEIFEFSPGQLEQAIIDHVIDIGITYHPIAKNELDLLKIKDIEMGIFGLKQFKKKPLEQLPFVAPLALPSSTPTRVRGLDGWPDQAINRKICFRVQLLETAMELCRQGSAVGYFPKFLIELHNKKHRKEFQLETISPKFTQNQKKLLNSSKQAIYLIKRKNMEESSDIKKLAKWIRMTC